MLSLLSLCVTTTSYKIWHAVNGGENSTSTKYLEREVSVSQLGLLFCVIISWKPEDVGWLLQQNISPKSTLGMFIKVFNIYIYLFSRAWYAVFHEKIAGWLPLLWNFPGDSGVKNLPAKHVQREFDLLSWEDPLEKEMATPSSILAGKSHGQQSLAGYKPWGCKKLGQDLATKQLQPLLSSAVIIFDSEGCQSLHVCDF